MLPTGQPLALCYGYQWVTGLRAQYYSLTGTGNFSTTGPEFTKTGCWLLGEGEWDGLEELFSPTLNITVYRSEADDPTHFHFHRGSDATIGAGLTPSSIGPDQGVDTFFSNLPAGVQPNCYNRIAHYWWSNKIARPGLLLNDTNKQDPTSWIDLDPVGLWRSLRVRLFNAQGQMEGYAFSTNPTWQMVDMKLRREIFPEFNIDLNNGITDLPAAARARFDWASLYDHADWCDAINSNTGRPNASGNFTFNQQATLQADLSVMLQSCRSYQLERNGQIGIFADQARASVFTLSRANCLSFTPTDRDVSNAANRVVGKFRDLLVTAVNGHITSISFPDHGEPTVTMSEPHPFAAGDEIMIGGTDTTYDTSWIVDTVPTGTEVYTFTMKSRGSNYPPLLGDVGALVGLTYSRFKERSPEWNHKQNQYAKGGVGIGLPRSRKKVLNTIDFHTSTIDQVSRVCRYERDRALGPDVVPYQTPVSAEAVVDLYALDAAGSGNVAIGIDPGDHISIDDTLSVPYAGEYEVIEAAAQPDTATADGRATAGSITLKLGTYSTQYMHDDYDASEAGWQNVPGSDPGSGAKGTTIPLADGQASFFTGIGASGDTVQLPSGFSPQHFLGWAGAAGYVEANNQLHCFRNCDIDQTTRVLSCIYSDGNDPASNLWLGDNSYAGLSWRTINSASITAVGAVTFTELTMLGGEKVIFGCGIVPGDGSFTVALPAGYPMASAICLVTCKDGVEIGDNDAHGFRAYVDTNGTVHSDYIDGEGNDWHAGNVRLFVFCAKNNMSTVTGAGNGWSRLPLGTSGQYLCWSGFDALDPGLNGAAPPNHAIALNLQPFTPANSLSGIPLPTGFSNITLQTFSGPTSFQIVDHPTHGIRDCYVDGNQVSQCSFEDGEGNIWYGTASCFLLLCDTPTGAVAVGVPAPSGSQAPPPSSGSGPTSGDGDNGGATVGSGSGSSGSSGSGSSGSTSSPPAPTPVSISGSSATATTAGGSVNFEVDVTPGSASTGITVTLNASQLGASASLALVGGQQSGSSIPFTGSCNVAANVAAGTYNLAATAQDAQGTSATTQVACSIAASPFAIASANSSSAQPGGTASFQVHVTLDTNSTGVGVTVDCSSFGGPSALALSAGTQQGSDLQFIGSTSVPANTATASYSLTVTAADAEGRSASQPLDIYIATPPAVRDAQIQPNYQGSQQGVTITGWTIHDGGTGYSYSSSTAVLSGSTSAGPKTVNCNLVIDSDGTITGISGGEGFTWSNVSFTLTR